MRAIASQKTHYHKHINPQALWLSFTVKRISSDLLTKLLLRYNLK
jgi:hypothetical protein